MLLKIKNKTDYYYFLFIFSQISLKLWNLILNMFIKAQNIKNLHIYRYAQLTVFHELVNWLIVSHTDV